ncbi:GrpB family protein [Thalassotalea sp. HSM 43]|uniref:GrpB family protein n=1 Tax=Thalassotalea sp. HSM 43 TaxID=2552945 RepID=UPI001081F57B|nr:GrpB family protein [Thalassotalea sp. HSM 43]QBY04373.1 GrpB family protein [Thalassotalea sp. HSM 43]
MYLFPHNRLWQADFEREKQAILSAFCGAIEVFHIGSTAIKGLYAKDCIDVLAVVDDMSSVAPSKQQLIDLGYVYKGEYGIAGRQYFSKPQAASQSNQQGKQQGKQQRKTHLHIYQAGDEQIDKHLHFVKVMRGNSALIAELNQLKRSLAAKYPNDKEAYQMHKKCFYDRLNCAK